MIHRLLSHPWGRALAVVLGPLWFPLWFLLLMIIVSVWIVLVVVSMPVMYVITGKWQPAEWLGL